jgi:hypothetical protein
MRGGPRSRLSRVLSRFRVSPPGHILPAPCEIGSRQEAESRKNPVTISEVTPWMIPAATTSSLIPPRRRTDTSRPSEPSSSTTVPQPRSRGSSVIAPGRSAISCLGFAPSAEPVGPPFFRPPCLRTSQREQTCTSCNTTRSPSHGRLSPTRLDTGAMPSHARGRNLSLPASLGPASVR